LSHSGNEYQRYYMRIYKATEPERDTYTKLLTECLKLNFENALIQYDYLKAEGLTAEIPREKRILTAEVTTFKGDPLPAVEIEEYLNQLIPFYKSFAENFYKTYKNNKVVDWDAVRGMVKEYQPCTLEDLKLERENLKKEQDKLVYESSYAEARRAHKLLDNAFADVPIGFKTKSEAIRLYNEAMHVLKREGFGYFESDRASGHQFFGQPLNYPYEGVTGTFDNLENYPIEEYVDKELLLKDKEIETWYISEREDIPHKRQLWTEVYEKDQKEAVKRATWLKSIKEWLTRFRLRDGSAEELAVAMQKAGLDAEHRYIMLEEYRKIHGSIRPKTLRMKPSGDHTFKVTIPEKKERKE
jgi:hypothetical protein